MHPLAIYYDLQIAQLLLASGAVCFLLLRDLRFVPRSLARLWPRLSRAVAALSGVVFFTVTYGSFIEPRLLTIHRVDVPLAGARRLTEPVRIAVISDLHLGPYKREGYLRRVVARTLRERPDAVLLAGDFVYADDGVDEWRHLAPLTDLATEVPTFAVFGNHDSGLGDELDFVPRPDHQAAIRAALEAAGVRTLENEHALLGANGTALAIAGLAELRTNRTNAPNALRGIPPEIPRIVLAHNPGVAVFLNPKTTDLLVVAHTHNGQVRLPLLPPLVRLPTPLGQLYDAGLFTWNDIRVFITSGAGESGPRARLFNPPEIAVLTIQ